MLRAIVVVLKATLAVLALEMVALQPSAAQQNAPLVRPVRPPPNAYWQYIPACLASFPSQSMGRVSYYCSLPPSPPGPLLYPGDRCYVGLFIGGAKIWSNGVVAWLPRFDWRYPIIDCLWGR